MPPGFEIVQRRDTNRNKIKIKVHAEDVRYILVPQDVEFAELVDRIRDKFGIRRRFKIKIRDEDSEGDMVTMGDQDDLDIALESTQGGKMEVSLLFFFFPYTFSHREFFLFHLVEFLTKI